MSAALPYVSIGAQVVGGVTKAIGAIKSGDAAQSAAKQNAAIAAENAAAVRDQAQQDMRQQRVIGRKALGGIRAAYSASGVNVEGTALDVLEESAVNAEYDALNIGYQAERRARGYDYEQAGYLAGGRAARAGGYLGASGTLLGTAGNVLKYTSFSTPKLKRTN